MNKKSKKYIFNYNMMFINIISILIFILMVIITFFMYKIFNKNFSIIGKEIVFIILLMCWFVIHEIIHGLFYIINGAKKENITYGVALEKGIFYCKCGEFVDKKNIMCSVIAPFLIIGIFTYIIGFIFNLNVLVLLSIFNICGAAGDLTMFCFFLKLPKDIKFKELEDSTKFCLLINEDLSNKKFWGVKLAKEVKDDSEITEEKRPLITITKPSKIILIIFGIIILLEIFLLLFFNIIN